MSEIKLSDILEDLMTDVLKFKDDGKVMNLVNKWKTLLDKAKVDQYTTIPDADGNGYEVVLNLTGGKPIELDKSLYSIFDIYVKFEGKDDDPPGEFSFFISEKNEHQYLDFKNVTLALGFDNLLLKSIDGKPSEIKYQGGVRINRDLSIELENDLGFSFSESRIGNTGIIIGFEDKFYLDQSPLHTPQPLKDKLGLTDEFIGVYFDKMTLIIEKDEFLEGFPEIKTEVTEAAFGNNGASFDLYQTFDVDEQNLSNSRFPGNLLFEDLKYAFKYIDLSLRNHKVEKLDFEGFIQIPVLNNPILGLTFNFENMGQNDKRLAYTITKDHALDDIEIASPGRFFWIKIKYLELSGLLELSDNRKKITMESPAVEATVGVEGKNDMPFSNARAEIKRTEEEAVFSVEIEELELEGFYFKDAKFLSKKKKNEQLEIGLSGHVKIETLDEAEIKLDLSLTKYDAGGHTFKYELEKKSEDDIVISLEDIFTLTIEELHAKGTIDKKKNETYRSLTGKLSGSLDLLNGDVAALNGADIEIKESAAEKIISIKLDDFNFITQELVSADLTIREATFYSIKYKEQAPEEGEEEKKEDEAYIELTLDLAASAIDQLVLPPHLDSAELKLDSKFKYAWKGDDRSLKSTSELTDITFINKYRDFIPAVFRPEVQSARLSYEHDWEKGNFQFKDGKIVVGISGEVKIKALEEAAISFDFAFINYHADGHTFTYKGKKKGEDDIVLSLENFYTLTIKKLNFDGSIDKKETGKYHNLEGALSGSLELLDGNSPALLETIDLENAKIEIKESVQEKVVTVELEDVNLVTGDIASAELHIEKTVFHSVKYKEQAQEQEEEQSEEEKKEDEAYIELALRLETQALNSLTLPSGLNTDDIQLNSKFKYTWKSTQRKLKGSLELKTLNNTSLIANHWNFIPSDFQPEIKSVILSYEHEWTKGHFSFKDGELIIGCLFSIDSLIKKIPFHELIDVRTGDEDGNIKAELIPIGDDFSLSILNAAEIHFFLPGDSHSDEPLIVNDINEIAIKRLPDGRSNFEISSEVDLFAIFGDPEQDPNASQNNKINAKISIDKLAYRFGVYGARDNQKAEVYFAFSGQAQEDAQNAQNAQNGAKVLQMAPGGIDGFIKKIFNGQDMGANSLSESEQVNELSEDTEEETKETKQVILENKKLGKLTLDLLKYEIPEVKELLEEKELSMYVKADVSADLGPFYAKVSGLGLKAWLTKSRPLTQRDILLGKFKGLDLKFGVSIVPPTKATFKLEAKAVSGGGHLEFDYDNHRYAGILALKLKVIDLTAVGLITTRLPNNKPGFSMLISISVIFNPGIQLSFGFTLKGVGGLIGVHRTFKIEALRSRFASGSINSIMFPQDPIKNADKIISDLRAIFPPQEKHYVAAPFLKIGWSKFVELDIGVLLEFPFKGRLILLGSVGLFLPERNNAIVELHIDVLGDFNFAEKYIRIEGILRDSRIKDIPVYGGFAFFLSWDGKPKFLFSAGGYHPRYKKPARFPDVPRVGTVINYSDKLSLTCEFYTAVTSNSFQTGFKADFLAKFSGAEIKGYLFFDALLYFRPFYFEVEIGMGVSVKYKKKELAGADLYFMLSGPKPWKAIGRAEFKFSVFSLEVDFSHTWGGSQPVEQAPSIGAGELLDKLEAELIKTANWAARLPENLNSLETLRSLNESEQGAVLHPCGYLEVRQQVVPLDRSIEKYGQAYVTGSPRYSITNFKVGGVSAEVEHLKEYFSRGQFEDLTDEEKISSPDFELMNAGLRLDSADDFDMSASVAAAPSEVYEDVILQSGGNARGASLREKAGGGINIRPVKIGPIRVDPGRPVGGGPGVQIGGGKTPVVPVSVSSRKKGKRTWKTDRYLLNRSGRRRRFDEQPEQSYRLTEPDLFFPETEEYAIKGRGLQGVSVFSTYSEAKDYLNSRESVGEWQVVTAKEAGKSLANDSVSTRK